MNNNNHENDRILDMYTVLINQVYLSHTRFLETVSFLEQGIRDIYNNSNNIPRNNRSNNNNRNYNIRTNNDLNNRTVNRPNFRNIDYFYNRTIPNRATPNFRHQRGFPETQGLSDFFSGLLSNQPPINFNNLSPVLVRPTLQQINNATEQINNTQTTHIMCPITQEAFEETSSIIRIRHCQHCFTREAIMNWFDRSVLCPVCRYDIRDFSNNHTPTDISNNTIPFQRTTSIESNNPIPFQRTTSMESTTSQDSTIENFLNTFTSQISESLSQHIFNNDISLNNLDNRALNLEYTIQTPNNVFTISTMSPESIGHMMRRIRNQNNEHNNNNSNHTHNDEQSNN